MGTDARAAALALAGLVLAACGPAVTSFGRPGLGEREFRQPRGIAASEHGVAVVDRSGRLQLFDLAGRPAGGFDVVPGDVRRGLPTGVAWLPDGRLLVADTHQSRLVVYTRDGRALRHIGEYGAEPGKFLFPQRVALAAGGELLVSEYGMGLTNRVQVFQQDGSFLRTFGGPEPERGGLGRVMACLELPDGRHLVADQRAGVVAFAADGAFLGRFGPALPEGSLPYGLCRTADGTLYAVDRGLACLFRYRPGGELVGRFGGPGSDLGRFLEPWDVAAHAGRLYVADTGNHRVQVVDPERVEWEAP